MELKNKDRYGLFKANSNIGDIEVEIGIYVFGERITVYRDGKEIEDMTIENEEDLDNYEENEKEIIIHVCNDEIIIEKSSMIEVDKITDRNEYLIKSVVLKQKDLSLEHEKSEWETISKVLNEAIIKKGYTKRQVREIIENIMKSSLDEILPFGEPVRGEDLNKTLN